MGEKLKKLSKENRFLSKNNYIILKNIELLCFINEERIEGYKKFIIDKLIKINANKFFIEYLQKYCFKKNIRDYNYSYLIEKFKKIYSDVEKIIVLLIIY